jgi:hypothetical protein
MIRSILGCGVFLAVIAAGSVSAPTPAEAKGCIKGAIVGGIAGHFAGHHGTAGAVAGCVIGRHGANKRDREQRDMQQGGYRNQ